MFKILGALPLLLVLIGCGTSIGVTKQTYTDDGQLKSSTEASYWSSKDIAAPSLAIDKDDKGYNMEMKAENANNSEPLKQVNEGMRIMLDGLSKIRP